MGTGGIECCMSRGESAREMYEVTSGGNVILLSRRSCRSGIAEGRRDCGCSPGEVGADKWPLGGTSSDSLAEGEALSSRSELCRLIAGGIAGGSERNPRPMALDEFGSRFPLTGSSPADRSLVFARSLSTRNRSLSETRLTDCARCFSMSFHS
jgi:hypothetical protein